MKKVVNSTIAPIKIEIGEYQTKHHNQILAKIITALHKAKIQILNYDHIQLDIPKYPQHLQYNGKRYDVVGWIQPFLFYLDLKTRKEEPWRVKKFFKGNENKEY